MRIGEYDRNIKARLILQFFTTLVYMTIAPYLVIYFSQRVGAVITSLMVVSVVLVSMTGSLMGGYLSDIWGRKKIIVLSEFTIFLGYSSIAFLNHVWSEIVYVTFYFILLIKFVEGIVSPAYSALIMDASSTENRKQIYTCMYWLVNLATAIGGIIGAFCFKEHLLELFLAMGVISLVCSFISLFIIEETISHRKERRKRANSHLTINSSILSVYKDILRDKYFLIFSISTVFVLTLEEQLTNYIGIRLQKEFFPIAFTIHSLRLRLDALNIIGILRLENTLIVVCLTVFVLKVIKQFQIKTVFLTGLFIFTIGYGAMSCSKNIWTLGGAMFIASIGELLHFPVKQTILADIIPLQLRSSYLAVYGFTTFIANALAAGFIFLGDIFSKYVMAGIFIVMGMLSMKLYKLVLNAKNKEEKGRKSNLQRPIND